ncbi:MAG TPA: tRNA lysidine(34) synthetase TilS [Paracoccus solventivorans]|uniref:tRNA lysidine(34) synthetase TilS n=1 Tax=Paracoccus solventivorans TaxID=53463 RepID=UPI002BDE1933|nr:tRNA lysidine(34) synthetase TilS [Paracoccus solventivorans]HMM08799.1 tRNA lysidine(34) synthetase TilS [Paracoccus solventivorans]
MSASPQAVPHAVAAALDRLAGDLPALGVAVSGGSDSLALLHLAAAWARPRGLRIEAATVDHRLRPESAAEAESVARSCAGLGIAHEILVWDHGGDVPGNLMDAARRARLRLLAGWAAARGLGAVALGHTQDDQAETLLMRLARGAGLDGLSGMAESRQQGGILWLRPLLGLRREALRDWLRGQGIAWADDPSNDDPGYERVRVRRAIAALGLPVPALARSAAYLAEARAALAEAAVAAAAGASADRGMLRLPLAALQDSAPEIRRRLLLAALRWVTGADYPPRGEDAARLLAALLAGGQGTLEGVIARVRGGVVEFLREPAAAARGGAVAAGLCPGATAVALFAENSPPDHPAGKQPWGLFSDPPSIPGAHKPGDIYAPRTLLWDRRWRLEGLPEGAEVTAAGEAEVVARDWRGAGLPLAALASSPLVTAGGRAILPLLDRREISAIPLRGLPEFAAILRSH